MRRILTKKTTGMTSFSIGTNRTIGTNGPSELPCTQPVTWENNRSPLNEMHIHQQNHWNDILFYWYQSYHWYQWTIRLTNRIRLCMRTTLGGLKRQGKKGTVGKRRSICMKTKSKTSCFSANRCPSNLIHQNLRQLHRKFFSIVYQSLKVV